MKLQKLLVVALSTGFLAACGGGGGDSSPSSPQAVSATPGQAQGVYSGTFTIVGNQASTGQLNMLILENDEYWGLYGTANASGGLTVYGLVQGQGVSNNGTFSSSNLKDYSNTVTGSGSLNVTYLSGISFNGTATKGTLTATIAANTNAANMASYNTPANLADIVGAWPGNALDGSAFNLTITSGGAISGSSVGTTCTVSGTITPRASGKNVFNVNLTTPTSAACGSNSGRTANGVAASSVLSSGQRQLLIALVTADRASGTVLFATR